MNGFVRSLFPAGIAILCPLFCAADVVYTNFGPDYSYEPSGFYTSYGDLPQPTFTLEGSFTVGPTAYLFDSARLALFTDTSGRGDNFELQLLDSNFNPLEAIFYTDPLGQYGSTVVVEASGDTLLEPFDTYWLQVSTTGTDNVDWYSAISDPRGTVNVLYYGGGESTYPGMNFALEVDGTPVAAPEPNSVTLFAGVCLVMGGWRRGLAGWLRCRRC